MKGKKGPVRVVSTFRDLSKAQRKMAGGKGGTLAFLYQRKYPVPDGLVILPSAFTGDRLSEEAWLQVKSYLERLRKAAGSVSFAVRSSALGEDSLRASFAGEFETVLDVRTDDQILSAIQTVRQLRHVERVRAYSQARGIPLVHDMAVVVQQMVRADISGVLFTADPVDGSRTKMVGNFVHGVGEKLVGGESQTSSFTLERPRYRYNGPSEFEKFARRLYSLATRLERDLGSPQDIEWVIEGNKTYIVQSRPITTLLGWDPVTGESNDSLTGDYAWSCVNVGEALYVVMTPFTWSVVHGCLHQVDFIPGYCFYGNIGGRPYANLTLATAVRHALKLDKYRPRDYEEIFGWTDKELDYQGHPPVPVSGTSVVAGFLIRLPDILPLLIPSRRNVARFVAENASWCNAMCRRITDMQTTTGIASLWENEIYPYVLRAFRWVTSTAMSYARGVGTLRPLLEETVGAGDAEVLLTPVSSKGELLECLGPVVGLSRVAHGQMSREAYLERWGHRSALEVETSATRPFEDAGWLDRELAAFNQSPVGVEELLAAQHAEFDHAWERLRAHHPRRAKAIRRRLEKCISASHLRETVRSEFTRLIWVIRTWARRTGEMTGIGDDAFFLTARELLDLLSGDRTSTVYIPARRQTYERYKALPPYPLSIRGCFDPFKWAQDPERRSDVFDSTKTAAGVLGTSHSERVITGIPGSAGSAEGTVRCLNSPEQGNRLERGEILVTSLTNIGWTLLFPRAGGIVTDIGAPLSHAAIVARELGIPAVVNCGNATMRLHTGDRVRIDGAQGTVEILGTEL